MTIHFRVMMMLLVLVIGGLGLLANQYHAAEERAKLETLQTTAEHLVPDILQMRRSEKDFLLRHNPQYVEQLTARSEHIKVELQGLQRRLIEVDQDPLQLKKMASLLDHYLSHFLTLYNIDVEIGLDETLGLRGELRKSIHAVERLFERIESDSLLKELLMLRRHEKDFLLRQEMSYWKRHTVSYGLLQQKIRASAITPKQKTQLDALLGDYQSRFSKLVKAKQSYGLSQNSGIYAEMREAAHQLEDDAKSTIDRLEIYIGQRKEHIEKSSSFILATVMMAILLLELFIARRISTSTRALVKQINTIEQLNGFSARIEVTAEDELGQLARSFNQLLEHLEDANDNLQQSLEKERQASEAKDNFLASMSHELRTPLASVIGNSELLIDECEESCAEQSRIGLIRSIQRAGEHQLALVNDILDMSKIESGKLSMDEAPYDLSLLLKDLEMMFLTKADDQGIQFAVVHNSEEPYQLQGDSQRIGQILINLLGNAFKFTEQGQVTLTVWSDSKYLFCSVKDSGIGMSPETIDTLFGRFEQVDGSISRRFGGNGLGLYLSLNLAEIMGGEIDVSSNMGEGSIFQLRLPYRPTDIPVQSNPADSQAESVLQQRYSGEVLIAEDTPELQLLERRILESMGVVVTTAENGQEAVAQATTNHFDLILMDMQMPVMDGIEATRVLRQQGVTTPVVPLTANVMQKHRDAFVAEGCKEFLAKPIDRQELRRVLNRFLAQPQEPRIAEPVTEPAAEPSIAVPPQAEEEVDDELMAIFIDSTTKNREKLKTALSEKAWPALRETAHTVKGSAASFGYPELSNIAEALQFALDEERMGVVPELAMDLLIEMGSVLP